jgi:hypothetical protein
MLRLFYFDPRRYHNFFDDVLDPEEHNLEAMREASGIGASYYEFWKVKPNFDFRALFREFPNAPGLEFHHLTIFLCIVTNRGEHENQHNGVAGAHV